MKCTRQLCKTFTLSRFPARLNYPDGRSGCGCFVCRIRHYAYGQVCHLWVYSGISLFSVPPTPAAMAGIKHGRHQPVQWSTCCGPPRREGSRLDRRQAGWVAQSAGCSERGLSTQADFFTTTCTPSHTTQHGTGASNNLRGTFCSHKGASYTHICASQTVHV